MPREPIISVSVEFIIVYTRSNDVWLAGFDHAAVHPTEPGLGLNKLTEFVNAQDIEKLKKEYGD